MLYVPGIHSEVTGSAQEVDLKGMADLSLVEVVRLVGEQVPVPQSVVLVLKDITN